MFISLLFYLYNLSKCIPVNSHLLQIGQNVHLNVSIIQNAKEKVLSIKYCDRTGDDTQVTLLEAAIQTIST